MDSFSYFCIMTTERLKEEIRRMTGKRMKSSGELEWLGEKIFERTRESLSPTTLKRVFGYLKENVMPRTVTLDILSKFAGYRNYADFCERTGDSESQSNMVMCGRLSSEELKTGQKIRLTWHPDRVCVAEHKGNGNFEVTEAMNTKLNTGDTFTCHLFICHEPLYLDNLVHNGGEKPTGYVAGKKDGIMFEIL